ncbi:unnamed protein product [Arctogadus glacialis]
MFNSLLTCRPTSQFLSQLSSDACVFKVPVWAHMPTTKILTIIASFHTASRFLHSSSSLTSPHSVSLSLSLSVSLYLSLSPLSLSLSPLSLSLSLSLSLPL